MGATFSPKLLKLTLAAMTALAASLQFVGAMKISQAAPSTFTYFTGTQGPSVLGSDMQMSSTFEKRSPGAGSSSSRGGKEPMLQVPEDVIVSDGDQSTPSPQSTPEADRKYTLYDPNDPDEADLWHKELEDAQRAKRKASESRNRAFRKGLHPDTRREMRQKRRQEERVKARREAMMPSAAFEEEFEHVLNELWDAQDPRARNVETMLRELIRVPGITRTIDQQGEGITEAEAQQYLIDHRNHEVPILDGQYTGRAQEIQQRYLHHLSTIGLLDYDYQAGGEVDGNLYAHIMGEVHKALSELKALRAHFHHLYHLADRLGKGEHFTEKDLEMVEGDAYRYKYNPATWSP